MEKEEIGLGLILLFFVLMPAGIGRAEDDSSGKSAAGADRKNHFRLDLKREATNRGTPGEKTKTQIKIDALRDGGISLLRLEVPFPDDKTSFEGDPFSPRLGDIKVRFGFLEV